MVKKFKIKTRAGKVIDCPIKEMKAVLSGSGLTGKLLVKATNELFKEVRKLTKEGVITATNLERAVVRSISNTNKTAIDTAQKFTKKMLK